MTKKLITRQYALDTRDCVEPYIHLAFNEKVLSCKIVNYEPFHRHDPFYRVEFVVILEVDTA